MKTSYNGYENRATWLVALWINNVEKEYRKYSHYAEVWDTPKLACEIRGNVYLGIAPEGLYDDLRTEYGRLSDVINSVDFSEVAESFKEEVE